MAITVEDGTGLTTADSFISVSDADAYHTARGNTGWTGTDTVKGQALVRATSYLEQKYGLKWAGYRKTSTQALSWPRQFVPIPNLLIPEYLTDSTIPVEVKNACAILALKALTAELITDEERAVISESVSGAVSVTYSEFASQQKVYPEISLTLNRYLGASSGLQMIRV